MPKRRRGVQVPGNSKPAGLRNRQNKKKSDSQWRGELPDPDKGGALLSLPGKL
jgi:hypothetical protein